MDEQAAAACARATAERQHETRQTGTAAAASASLAGRRWRVPAVTAAVVAIDRIYALPPSVPLHALLLTSGLRSPFVCCCLLPLRRFVCLSLFS